MFYGEGIMQNVSILGQDYDEFTVLRAPIKKGVWKLPLGDMSLKVTVISDTQIAIHIPEDSDEASNIIANNTDENEDYTLNWLRDTFGMTAFITISSEDNETIIYTESDENDVVWSIVYYRKEQKVFDKRKLLEDE